MEFSSQGCSEGESHLAKKYTQAIGKYSNQSTSEISVYSMKNHKCHLISCFIKGKIENFVECFNIEYRLSELFQTGISSYIYIEYSLKCNYFEFA